MQIKEIPPNNPRIVMAVEAVIGIGLVLIWISLLLYHLYAHDEPPAFSASDSLAKKAILLTYPDLKPIHLSLFLVGFFLVGVTGLVGLLWLESRQTSLSIGIYAGFFVMVSAWHLFRVEGRDAISRLLDSDPNNDAIPNRDLWAPLLSNFVLLFFSLILIHKNLLDMDLHLRLDPDKVVWVKGLVSVGVLIGQFYFSAMIYVNFWVGYVLLCACPAVTVFGLILIRVWDSKLEGSEQEQENLVTGVS